jgi:hypothetical protein
VTSDRWWAYTHLPLARRQLCWAHLRRDFTAHAEGLAAEKEFGEHGLELCERVFWAWEVFQNTSGRLGLDPRLSARVAAALQPVCTPNARRESHDARSMHILSRRRGVTRERPAPGLGVAGGGWPGLDGVDGR